MLKTLPLQQQMHYIFNNTYALTLKLISKIALHYSKFPLFVIFLWYLEPSRETQDYDVTIPINETVEKITRCKTDQFK